MTLKEQRNDLNSLLKNWTLHHQNPKEQKNGQNF